MNNKKLKFINKDLDNRRNLIIMYKGGLLRLIAWYYRKKVPKVLLDGAIMAKPVITTGNVGCRDVVSDGYVQLGMHKIWQKRWKNHQFIR